MYCRKCGKKVEHIKKYCPECGEKLKLSWRTFLSKRKKPLIVGAVFLVLIFCVFDYFNSMMIFRYFIIRDGLTTGEIKTISNSVGSIICPGKTRDGVYEGAVSGSGTYLLLEPEQNNMKLQLKALITNGHVAQLHDDEKRSDLNHCSIDFSTDGKLSIKSEIPEVSFHYDSNAVRRSDVVDVAILIPDKIENLSDYLTKDQMETSKITKEDIENGLESHLLQNGGRQIPFCKTKNPIGKKVYIFGYPSSAETEVINTNPPTIESRGERAALGYLQYRFGRHLVVTEGIISGKERENYFTTALIDTGSSGGLAVLKNRNQPCLFGIPTWGTMGDLTTMGIIQPFTNVFSAGFDWEKIGT